MKTLQSYVCGRWQTASEGFVPLVNPSNEVVLAQISSHGIGFGEVLEFARKHGGPALRCMSFAERGAVDVHELPAGLLRRAFEDGTGN